MIIFRDLFANLSNWTTTTSTGSVSASGGTCTIVPGAGGFNSTGMVLTTGIAGAAGQTWEILMNPSSNSTCNYMLGLRDSATFDFSGMVSYYVDGGSPNSYQWDVNTSHATGISPTTGSYKSIKVILQPNSPAPVAQLNYDGSDIASPSVNWGSGPYAGDLHYQVNVDTLNGSSGTLLLQEFVVTDDGSYDPPAPDTLSNTTPSTAPSHSATIPLTWNNNGDATSQDGFNIYFSIDGGSFSLGHQVNNPAATGYSYVTTQGHHVQFKIVSYVIVDSTVYESTFSNTLSLDTPTDPPTSLVAVAAPAEIDLTWSSTTDGWEDGYSIERSLTSGSGFSEIDTVGSATLDYEDTTVVPGVTYYYRVRSFWSIAHPPTIYSAYTNEASATIISTGSNDGEKLIVLGEL